MNQNNMDGRQYIETDEKGSECAPLMPIIVNCFKVEKNDILDEKYDSTDRLYSNTVNEPPLQEDIMYHGIKVENDSLNGVIKKEVDTEGVKSTEYTPESKESSVTDIKIERESVKEELIDIDEKGVLNAGEDYYKKEKKTYTCDICHKLFVTKDQLSIHSQIHSGEKTYSCKICLKIFNHKGLLNCHLTETHSGVKALSCDVCKKRFHRSYNLRMHMTTHFGKKPYSCNTCNKSYTDKTGLARHMMTHTGEQPYTCDICFKTLTHNSVRAHQMQHSGEKPFPCKICNKVFYQKCRLKYHMRTHTGEKPYSCEICNTGFTNKSNLMKHFTHMTHLRRLTSSEKS